MITKGRLLPPRTGKETHLNEICLCAVKIRILAGLMVVDFCPAETILIVSTNLFFHETPEHHTKK
jgi:hypothetical protein